MYFFIGMVRIGCSPRCGIIFPVSLRWRFPKPHNDPVKSGCKISSKSLSLSCFLHQLIGSHWLQVPSLIVALVILIVLYAAAGLMEELPKVCRKMLALLHSLRISAAQK